MSSLEAKRRTFAKTLTWRVMATLATILIVFILTGRIILSIQVGIIEVIVKSLFYVVHERIWAHVHWGKKK